MCAEQIALGPASTGMSRGYVKANESERPWIGIPTFRLSTANLLFTTVLTAALEATRNRTSSNEYYLLDRFKSCTIWSYNLTLGLQDIIPSVAITRVNLLCSVILSFLPVEEVQAFGFDLTVDERASETGQELLGCRVVVGFTVPCLVVLVRFSGLECCSPCDKLM